MNDIKALDLQFTLQEVLAFQDNKSKPIRITVAISGAPVSALKKNDEEYLTIPVSDATAAIDLKVWEKTDKAKARFVEGSIWSINVAKDSWNGNPQLTFLPGDSKCIVESPDELSEHPEGKLLSDRFMRMFSVPSFIETLTGDLLNMKEKEDLREEAMPMWKTVMTFFGMNVDTPYFDDQEVQLRILESSEDTDIIKDDILKPFFMSEIRYEEFCKFLKAPAAKGHHGNVLYGLAWHLLGMRNILRGLVFSMDVFRCASNGRTINEIDSDLILAAVYVHDFRKINEYKWTALGGVSMSDEKSIFYHDMRTAFTLQSIKDSLFGVGSENTNTRLDRLTEMILTHHGQYSEYQPDARNRPVSAEAKIFHLIDNMEATFVGAMTNKDKG